ncbi:hypothetical protein NKI39_25940 [Mesorhizobium sp. M0664]
MNDMRQGKNRLELHFWRVGAETRWKRGGDPSLVEARSCAIGANLRSACV